MKIKKFKKISSTNKKAKDLARKEVSPWTVVLAEEQSTGYGKEKREWFSPKGGLYFSIILPKSKIDDLQTLTILAAFVVAKTIKEEFSLESLIKLPNDVLILSQKPRTRISSVQGKKVAGILTENVIGRNVRLSVMGIGLNTNIEEFPEKLKNTATSLKIELGKKVDNMEILKKIIKGIKEQLKIISE